MVRRLRRSDGTRRQQLRLVALGAVLVLLGLVNLVFVQSLNGGRQTFAVSVPLFTAFLLLPVFHTMAVLRYRLMMSRSSSTPRSPGRRHRVRRGRLRRARGRDRRSVDSRTGGFGALARGDSRWSHSPSSRCAGGGPARQPACAYGPRARPYVALSDFSGALVEAPRPETLLPAVADAAGRAVSAQGATATLDVPGLGVLSASWGERRDSRSAVRRPGPQRRAGAGPHHGAAPRGSLRPVDRRRPPAGPRRPGRDGVPQHRAGGPAGEPGRRSGSHDPRARASPGSGSSTPTWTPGGASRRPSPGTCCPGSRPSPRASSAPREALAAGSGDPGLGALLDDTNTALGVAPRAHARRLPHSARAGRAGAGAAVAAGRRRAWRSILEVEDSRGGRPVRSRGWRWRLLLLRRGGARDVRRLPGRATSRGDELWLRLRGHRMPATGSTCRRSRTGWPRSRRSLEVREREVTVRVPTVQAGSSRQDQVGPPRPLTAGRGRTPPWRRTPPHRCPTMSNSSAS